VVQKVLTAATETQRAAEPRREQEHQRCMMTTRWAVVVDEVRVATAAAVVAVAVEVENLTQDSRVQLAKVLAEVSALHAVLPWHPGEASRLEEEEMEVIFESGSCAQVGVAAADSVGHRVPSARRCDKRGMKTQVVSVQLVL